MCYQWLNTFILEKTWYRWDWVVSTSHDIITPLTKIYTLNNFSLQYKQ